MLCQSLKQLGGAAHPEKEMVPYTLGKLRKIRGGVGWGGMSSLTPLPSVKVGSDMHFLSLISLGKIASHGSSKRKCWPSIRARPLLSDLPWGCGSWGLLTCAWGQNLSLRNLNGGRRGSTEVAPLCPSSLALCPPLPPPSGPVSLTCPPALLFPGCMKPLLSLQARQNCGRAEVSMPYPSRCSSWFSA